MKMAMLTCTLSGMLFFLPAAFTAACWVVVAHGWDYAGYLALAPLYAAGASTVTGAAVTCFTFPPLAAR